MLFEAEDLHEQIVEFAAGRGIRATFDRTAIVAAIDEATSLAAGRAVDEPAAIFLALARRSRALTPVAADFIPALVNAYALALGFQMMAMEVELSVFRARILLDGIEWDELRTWFAARLRPLTPPG
jgi:hypothetical protein